MISTFGNNIISAFTGGISVKAIYTYGEKVWPSEPVPPTGYYIRWTPSDLSGSFTIGGEARWLQDYNGYYSGPFLSKTIRLPNYRTSVVHMIDAFAFQSTGVLAVETNLEFISQRAFMDCSSLMYVSMPNIVKTNGGVFRNCIRLGDVELPALSYLSANTFNGCSNLRDVSLPECRIIGLDDPAFVQCYNLQSVYLPKCSALDNYAFAYNGLSIIELPVCSIIGPSAFAYCSSLHTLILGYNGVASYGANMFYSTQIRSNTGSIYVPLSWVSEYKSASGWATYSAIIQPITTQ